MSNLVGNPKDRFPRDTAQIIECLESDWESGGCRFNTQSGHVKCVKSDTEFSERIFDCWRAENIFENRSKDNVLWPNLILKKDFALQRQ